MHNRRPHSVGTRRLAGAPRCALRCASGRAARPRVCGLERQRRERYGVDTGVQAGAGGTSKGRRLLRAERGPPVAPQAPLPSAPTRCSAQYHEPRNKNRTQQSFIHQPEVLDRGTIQPACLTASTAVHTSRGSAAASKHSRAQCSLSAARAPWNTAEGALHWRYGSCMLW